MPQGGCRAELSCLRMARSPVRRRKGCKLPDYQAARLAGCQAASLPDCQAAKLPGPGCQAASWLGCQAADLPGCQAGKLPSCQVGRLQSQVSKASPRICRNRFQGEVFVPEDGSNFKIGDQKKTISKIDFFIDFGVVFPAQ